jgi:cytochrome P450 family 6
MLFLKASIGNLFENIYKEPDDENYGGTYMLRKPGFIFLDTDIIKNILAKDFSSFNDRGFFMDEKLEPPSGHLLIMPERDGEIFATSCHQPSLKLK